MKSWRFWLPALAFGALVLLLARGLSLNPRELPSPLIGKPAPAFVLPSLHDAGRTVRRDELLGKPWVLNVWASWCAPCRSEHPQLVAFAQRSGVTLVGWNYKDRREDAQPWLRQLGDPYRVSVFDGDGRAAIDLGVYGVPETFVVDAQGIVRFKHVGPLTPEVIAQKIEPLLRSL
jgi:cytochrome c biogenesis protein CcmG/thiol:disulfide interchange protein DsbE